MNQVEVRRAKRGLSLRNQFRVVLNFGQGDEFAHTETYTNHSYAVDLARRTADALGWDFVDTTGLT